MPYLVGTDEAGYGPNLGPLVVSATAWRVDSIDVDLFERLRGVVRRACDPPHPDSIVIGDSKDLYKPRQGLARLEEGVFTCLAAIKKRPRTWKAVFRGLAKADGADLAALPWYGDFDAKLPVDLKSDQLNVKSRAMMACCASENAMPTHIVSRVVTPRCFNDLCETLGNKATVLSHATLRLVRSILSQLPNDEEVYVLCDKHGGRKRYGPLLQEVFPDSLVIVRNESQRESSYALGSGHPRREFAFRSKADAVFLPAALASMVSKYLRELAMQAFNDFWTSHVEDLKPTAGYPLDAKRFKTQIESAQRALGIADSDLWRRR